jgi:hypothetical protein
MYKKCAWQKGYKMRTIKYFLKIYFGGCRYEQGLLKSLLVAVAEPQKYPFFNLSLNQKNYL